MKHPADAIPRAVPDFLSSVLSSYRSLSDEWRWRFLSCLKDMIEMPETLLDPQNGKDPALLISPRIPPRRNGFPADVDSGLK
jgi:hypothetical protein